MIIHVHLDPLFFLFLFSDVLLVYIHHHLHHHISASTLSCILVNVIMQTSCA